MTTDLRRRLVVYVTSLLVLIAVYSAAYRWGMAAFEEESRTWFGAMDVVVQSMTTTGYGQDAPWTSVEMTLLMVLIQVTGIAYIFVAFPAFVVPWLERLVRPAPPGEIGTVTDHVIVVGYTSLCRTLVDELEATGTGYVIVEPDEERARSLFEADFSVTHGDPSSAGTLADVQLDDARAVVVDASNREHIGSIVEIDRLDVDADVFAIVADPERARYLRYAGVDEVLSPKHRLGKALADKLRSVVDTDGVEFGDGFDCYEFQIGSGSDLLGDPLVAARRVESDGATVLGAWVRGDFFPTLPSDLRIDRNTTLLVAGATESLERVESLTRTDGRPYRPERTPAVVVGTGIVGSAAIGTLERADLEWVAVDLEDGPFVDVVGDATEEAVLSAAGVDDAGSIILALDEDREALVTSLVARALNPDVSCLVGANLDGNVERFTTAGADYVLALPSVAGRMLTEAIFEREAMTFADSVHVRSTDVPGWLADDFDRSRVRERTGCSLVAIERHGRYYSPTDDLAVVSDDRLVVAGTESRIDAFGDEFDADADA
ncbi:potassium channel family protein [Halovivax gelatinilyticus]|uniref:potassium channel family protein n=1 Tax=Halovivax gelatinilyticus TaxID=2961597 RepID=UPI0020CA55C2|nr:NAD-binding protein [Halovivax gelatinilyticus]